MSHVRQPKLIEERLAWHKEYFIANPAEMRGRWRSLMPDARRVRVDLGCGKGTWITRAAAACPDDLLIGMDCERMCASFAVERLAHEGLRNAFIVHGPAHEAHRLFDEGEVDVMHVNFPTPFPRKKEASMRVTDAARLMEYRAVLGARGELHLKTDSQPYFDWTLEELKAAGYCVECITRDMHEEWGRDAEDAGGLRIAPDLIMSAYEERFIPLGAKIHALVATPGPTPENWQPRETVSLVDYLPEDLESIGYVPHGMQDTVVNIRNRARRAAARQNKNQG